MVIALVSKMDGVQRKKLLNSYKHKISIKDFSDKRDDLISEGVDVEVVYGNVRPFELPKLTKLKWVHATWTGVENLLYPELIKREVIITNTKGQSAISMAEHIVAALYYMARSFNIFYERTRQSIWKGPIEMTLLEGSTVLILGIGAIGRVLAAKLQSLGIHVIGVNSTGKNVSNCEEMYTIETVSSILSRVNHLVVCLPGTQQTHKVVDRKFLSSLAPGATVTAVSRGSVLDEHALIELIEKKHIAQAVLDVTNPEPPPPDSPLFNNRNILLTSHQSYLPFVESSMTFNIFEHNLGKWLEGDVGGFLNVVDYEKGY